MKLQHHFIKTKHNKVKIMFGFKREHLRKDLALFGVVTDASTVRRRPLEVGREVRKPIKKHHFNSPNDEKMCILGKEI
jgi:hypothetical protein